MKTCNRLALQLGLALVIVLVGALLNRVRPAAPAALAEGEKAPSQAQEKNVKPPPPDDGGYLNNMRNVPEETKRAIAELERAGVRVWLYQHQGDKEHEDEGEEDDEDEDDEEAPGEPIGVTFRTARATANQPGFQAQFTRKMLGRLLRSLPNVNEIDLRETNVSDDHLEELKAVATLTRLRLDDTPITDKGLANLATLTKLTLLSLSDNKQITDMGLANLAALTNLDSLALSDTQITDAGLAYLRGMEKLEGLGLGGTKIRGPGLENLSKMKRLEDLDLDRNDITDAGLAHLPALPLQMLCLDATHVTDAGLIHLKGMTELYYLTLIDTKVTTAGLAQLRHLTKLQGIKEGNVTYGGISLGQSHPKNPATIEPATPAQIARLKDVLWWLPADSEVVCVEHGPVTFSFPTKEPDEAFDSTVRRFQLWTRPKHLTDTEISALDQVPVALVVHGCRLVYEGCHIVVFERPLGDAGDSFMAEIGRRATKMELIGDTTVAQIDANNGTAHSTAFIARPAQDVLLFADNRDYLAEVLARMAKKAARRAFDDDLPEWKHLDLSGRQWAMRHYNHAPNPTFVGLVYSVQAGDVAKVHYVSCNENALEVAKRSWGSSDDVEVRQLEPNLIEISYCVREGQAIIEFFVKFFCRLWGPD